MGQLLFSLNYLPLYVLIPTMREVRLKNGINACIKRNEDTPRTALVINFSINEPEKIAGQYLLLNRLLMKGTKKYSSEELSSLLDENAIELYTEMKYDYLKFRFVSLNEDFEFALSILKDIFNLKVNFLPNLILQGLKSPICFPKLFSKIIFTVILIP